MYNPINVKRLLSCFVESAERSHYSCVLFVSTIFWPIWYEIGQEIEDSVNSRWNHAP